MPRRHKENSGFAVAGAGIAVCVQAGIFVADERGQILAELENFAFVPRLDFMVWPAFMHLLLPACCVFIGKFRKAAVAFAVIIAFMSGVRDMYAQKSGNWDLTRR